MKILRTTAPALNPVSLAEAKLHSNVEHGNDDGLLFGLIDAAVAYSEHYTGLKLMDQVWTAYLDCFESTMELPFKPIQSVVVKYDNGSEQILSTNDYYLDDKSYPGTIEMINWPEVDSAPNSVRIEVTCGETEQESVSGAVKSAIFMLVSHMYENREASTTPQMNALPFGVGSLLDTAKVDYA